MIGVSAPHRRLSCFSPFAAWLGCALGASVSLLALAPNPHEE
jgi:hypothetical protein